MNTFHEYNMVAINYKHEEMMRQAEHARLVRAVRQSRKGQTHHFADVLRNMTRAFAAMVQRTQQRNARPASGHVR